MIFHNRNSEGKQAPGLLKSVAESHQGISLCFGLGHLQQASSSDWFSCSLITDHRCTFVYLHSRKRIERSPPTSMDGRSKLSILLGKLRHKRYPGLIKIMGKKIKVVSNKIYPRLGQVGGWTKLVSIREDEGGTVGCVGNQEGPLMTTQQKSSQPLAAKGEWYTATW